MENNRLERLALWTWRTLPKNNIPYHEPTQGQIDLFVDMATAIKRTAYIGIIGTTLYYGLIEPKIIKPLTSQQSQNKTELINK